MLKTSRYSPKKEFVEKMQQLFPNLSKEEIQGLISAIFSLIVLVTVERGSLNFKDFGTFYAERVFFDEDANPDDDKVRFVFRASNKLKEYLKANKLLYEKIKRKKSTRMVDIIDKLNQYVKEEHKNEVLKREDIPYLDKQDTVLNDLLDDFE